MFLPRAHYRIRKPVRATVRITTLTCLLSWLFLSVAHAEAVNSSVGLLNLLHSGIRGKNKKVVSNGGWLKRQQASGHVSRASFVATDT